MRHNQKGTAIVEFGIVVPLLMLLVFGAIEFGLLFYNKQMITNASREGARAGITPDKDGNVDEALIRKTVKDYCKKIEADGSIIWIIKNLNPPYYIEIKDSDIGVSPPDENNDLSVTVTLNYPLFFSQILSIDDTAISARTTMRMEPAL